MSRYPTDTKWFKNRIKDKKLTQKELAHFVGMEDTAIYRFLEGARPLRVEEAVKMATILEVPLYDVLERVGASPSLESISLPIVGSVNGSLDITTSMGLPPVRSIPLFETTVLGLICDDNLSPFYGWVFTFIPASEVEPSAIGRLSVVKLSSGKMLIRFLKPGLNAGKFDLGSLNGPTLNNFDVFTASPVLLIRPFHGE
jgi:transcriptional regulator with XRE-family HTH domain